MSYKNYRFALLIMVNRVRLMNEQKQPIFIRMNEKKQERNQLKWQNESKLKTKRKKIKYEN